MPDIKRLYDLQEVDLELDKRNARLAEIAQALGDESSLTRLRAGAVKAKQQAVAVTAKQTDLDNVIGGFDAKIAEAEAKLYGGTVKLARELTDLQADIDMIKRQRSEQEDSLLEVMEELDSANETLSKFTRALAKAEKQWNADQASMTEEQATLQTEVAELTKTREAKAQGIPPIDIATYDQIRKTHQGHAIAKMQSATCGSCRVGIPNRQAQDARAGDKAVRCPNCGLILLPE